MCILYFFLLFFFVFSAGWIDCWTTPIAALSITYTYHPMPLLHVCSDPVAGLEDNINSGLELEEALLIPLRPIRHELLYSKPPDDFEVTSMEPDLIGVELEVGPSVLCLFGSLLLSMWNIKVGIFNIWVFSLFNQLLAQVWVYMVLLVKIHNHFFHE